MSNDNYFFIALFLLLIGGGDMYGLSSSAGNAVYADLEVGLESARRKHVENILAKSSSGEMLTNEEFFILENELRAIKNSKVDPEEKKNEIMGMLSTILK